MRIRTLTLLSPCQATDPAAFALGRCVECQPGSANDDPSSGACAICVAGSFAQLPGQAQCSLCPPGSASSAIAATSPSVCGLCPPGTFAASPGSTRCLPCAFGSSNALSNRTRCAACDAFKEVCSDGAIVPTPRCSVSLGGDPLCPSFSSPSSALFLSVGFPPMPGIGSCAALVQALESGLHAHATVENCTEGSGASNQRRLSSGGSFGVLLSVPSWTPSLAASLASSFSALCGEHGICASSVVSEGSAPTTFAVAPLYGDLLGQLSPPSSEAFSGLQGTILVAGGVILALAVVFLCSLIFSGRQQMVQRLDALFSSQHDSPDPMPRPLMQRKTAVGGAFTSLTTILCVLYAAIQIADFSNNNTLAQMVLNPRMASNNATTQRVSGNVTAVGFSGQCEGYSASRCALAGGQLSSPLSSEMAWDAQARACTLSWACSDCGIVNSAAATVTCAFSEPLGVYAGALRFAALSLGPMGEAYSVSGTAVASQGSVFGLSASDSATLGLSVIPASVVFAASGNKNVTGWVMRYDSFAPVETAAGAISGSLGGKLSVSFTLTLSDNDEIVTVSQKFTPVNFLGILGGGFGTIVGFMAFAMGLVESSVSLASRFLGRMKKAKETTNKNDFTADEKPAEEGEAQPVEREGLEMETFRPQRKVVLNPLHNNNERNIITLDEQAPSSM